MPTAARSLLNCNRPRQERRPDSRHALYNDRRWRKARLLHLARNPLCVACQTEEKLTAATVVDHVIPHRGDVALFWDTTNWQSLCETCHNRKTGSGQ